MRLFATTATLLLAAAALPAAARADGAPPAAHRQITVRQHIVRTRHIVRYRTRGGPPPVTLAAPAPIFFDWTIPDPSNPGYDRAMVLLYRSPAVSGVYTDDPGYPTIPVVTGAPYEYDACCAAFQYDGMAGAYVQLSQADAAHLPPPPPQGGVPIPPPP